MNGRQRKEAVQNFALVALAVVLLLASCSVFAHGDAEWIRVNPEYVDRSGVHCCGPTDCAVAQPGEIERIVGGWMHVPTRSVIADGERGIYYSKDAQVWRCVRGGVLRCLFVPGLGA